MEIVLATRNRKKVEEFGRILTQSGLTLRSLDEFPDCPEVVEDQATFEGNAVKKARVVAARTGLAAVADDSGLEVDALGGAPGVFSARWAGPGADDRKNREKLLSELRSVSGGRRAARFVCCIALAFPDGRTETFFGRVEGTIGFEPRGENGFGYDPVFIPDGPEGHARTFAEMAGEEKDALSHRGRALRSLKNYLAGMVGSPAHSR
ncbi:MAG: XTP/dITP diphosphatase [Nitrospirae bacterium]|nr:XTP/dITP diphosphatase [Nitrospirota bacterium]